MEKKNLKYEKIAPTLERWYLKHERHVPWRDTPKPYYVWISEIMLQQTTMTVVLGYFKRFTEKWPTLKALSEASQEEVNEIWAGLGYYSRARNILKTAKILMQDYKGKFPETADELIKLPGIGPYTSRAISSISFQEKVGVVDGNVLRLFNRLVGEKVSWWEKSFYKDCQKFADKLCSLRNPRNINQALMDMGAVICSPKNPTCSICPLQSFCLSYKKNLQNEVPLPKPRKQNEFWSYRVYTNSLKKPYLYVNSAEKLKSPVFKKRLLPLGEFKKVKEKPKKYSFAHSITHHKIYVSFISPPKSARPKPEKISLTKLKQLSPTSLIEKIWQDSHFHGKI